MKLSTFLLACLALVTCVHARERLSLNDDWTFAFGTPDDLGYSRYLNKGGRFSTRGIEFKGAKQSIRLPHDWAVDLPPSTDAYDVSAFTPVGPKFPATTIGWYKRTFAVPETDAGKTFWLEFDGIFRNAQIWVNGTFIARQEGGYQRARFDVTDLVMPGQVNDLWVRVDASQHEGWWYEGAGIYRNAWLVKTASLAVAPDGIFVHPESSGNVPVEVTLLNRADAAANAELHCKNLDPKGARLAEASTTLTAAARTTTPAHLAMEVKSPALWSPETPMLHTLVTRASVKGQVLDETRTAFGFRTARFDAERGFLLNGKPTPLKGVCLHHDFPGVGTAMTPSLHAYRLDVLRSFGVNAIRMSHNPADPALMDLCDQRGFLVMAEVRPFGSTPYALDQLRELVARDRNHPSVILWSIGNEEAEQNTDIGERMTRTVVAEIRRLDPTRPTTMANNKSTQHEGVNAVVDVHGWNYGKPADWKKYHEENPKQPTVITEYFTGRGTRGLYPQSYEHFQRQARYSSYRNAKATFWDPVRENPWLSGMFVWTGFDYGGETELNDWPVRHSSFGVVDRCGNRKDLTYFFESVWVDRPMVHLLPHWNWPDKVGKEIQVVAINNVDEVELRFNGATFGPIKQGMKGKASHEANWKIPYQPGRLEAIGYRNGVQVASDVVETTGEPAALRANVTRAQMPAAWGEISLVQVTVVDVKGRPVPTANNQIDFRISGPGETIGVGNGDPLGAEKEKASTIHVFCGLGMALIGATPTNGTLTVEATSPGLTSTRVEITTTNAPH